jgi:hypothetical protein
MGTAIRSLKALAARYNIAILLTNHMVTDGFDKPSTSSTTATASTAGGSSNSMKTVRPALGESYSYSADTRIRLEVDHSVVAMTTSSASRSSINSSTSAITASAAAKRRRFVAIMDKSPKTGVGAAIRFDINDDGIIAEYGEPSPQLLAQ